MKRAKLKRHTLKMQIVALWQAENNWPETEIAQTLKGCPLGDDYLIDLLEDLQPVNREYTALRLIVLNLLSIPHEQRKEVIEDAKVTQRRQRQQETKFGL